MSNPPITSSNLHKIALLERRLSTPGPGGTNSNGALPETGFPKQSHSPMAQKSSLPRSESSTLIPSPSNSSSLHSNPSNPGQAHGPGFSHDTSSNPIYDSVASPDQVKKRKMKEPVKKEIKKVKKTVVASSSVKRPTAGGSFSSATSNQATHKKR